MVGKKLIKNLSSYLGSLSSITIPVYTADQHTTRELPCIVVGYESETNSFAGYNGHFTVNGYVNVIFQGYEDLTNDDADSTAQTVIDIITDRDALETALNAPLSGSDTRPLTGFGLNQLIVRGATREKEDHSDKVVINFDAFCAAIDF